MIVSFQGRAARDIWEREQSRLLPRDLWLRAKALLTIMHATRSLNDLRINNGEFSEVAIENYHGLGTSAEMWVRMQADYDLWLARKNAA